MSSDMPAHAKKCFHFKLCRRKDTALGDGPVTCLSCFFDVVEEREVWKDKWTKLCRRKDTALGDGPVICLSCFFDVVEEREVWKDKWMRQSR